MTSSNLVLREIPSETINALKKEANRSGLSMNKLALKILDKELGLSHERFIYHDLDHLAGSWSPEEEKIFKKNTKFFEKNDKKNLEISSFLK